MIIYYFSNINAFLFLGLQVPNVIGFILGIFQMVLYGVYRNYDAKKEDVKEQQELEIVVGQEEEKKKEAQ